MKKALKVLAIFLCYSLIGLFIGTLLYSLYENLLNYIAGNKFVLFNFDILKNAFFYIAACLIFFITSVVSYSRIRYKAGFSQLLAFVVVAFVSWAICLPLVLKFGCESIKGPLVIEQNLSANYFRSVDDDVFYIIEDNDNNDINYVHIDTGLDGKVTLETVENQDKLPLKAAAKPYSDVLIANKIESDNLTSDFINLRLILQNALKAFSEGWTFFLGFLSLGFLLSSVYGLSNIFNWKLINASLVMLVTLLILAFNTAFYNGALDGFKNLGIWKLPFVNAFGKIVNEPVLVIINCLAGFCFVITGIVRYFVSHKKTKKRGDDK